MLTTPRTMTLILLLGDAIAANAFEHRWIAGLDLSPERLGGQTGVNGVLFRIERATGRDVPVLAERMFREWQRDLGTDPVLSTSEAGWRLFGRIYRGESEVVQWRGLGGEAELIWSITDLRAGNSSPPGMVPKPRDCSWLPPVHGKVEGRPFLQTSGYCQRASTTVAGELQQLLSSGKWVLHQAGGGLLQVEHGHRKAQIVLMPAGSPAQAPATNVVILELGIDPAQSP